MKPSKKNGFAFLVILGLALIGAFAFTVTGLSNGPPTPGVWHVLGDISRDMAGTLSVDPDTDGLIDFVDTDTINTAQVVDGSLKSVDVDPNEVCVLDTLGNSSLGCPRAPDTYCTEVYNKGGSGIITMPHRCGNGDNPAGRGGGCTIVMAAYDASGGNPFYTSAQYVQFPSSNNIVGIGGNFAWSSVEYSTGASQQNFHQGTNGDSTSTDIMAFSGIFNPPDIQLRDDSGGETQNYQWHLNDNDGSHNAIVWIC